MGKAFKKNKGRILGSRLTATVSISLVLLLFAILITLGVFARDISRQAKENIGITLVLNDNISADQLKNLRQRIQRSAWAKSHDYISKEKALEELSAELGENPESLLGYNPLPATIEVKMNPDFSELEQIRSIAAQLESQPGVTEVAFQEDLIQLVNKNLLSIGQILLGVALVLTLISFMLIRNTVRLMIYAKRFLIHTMCLVGARRRYIRRSFVRQNALCGVISALLSMGLFYLGLQAADRLFPGLTALTTSTYLLGLTGCLAGLGVLLSVLSTVFSVNRFLNMSTDDLYYI